MGLLRRRERTGKAAEPEQRERTAVLASELRLLSARLRSVADELAAVHGVERRGGDNGER